MKILQVKKFPIYDVFLDEGWTNWSRYLFKKGKLIHLDGAKLASKSILNQIAKDITNEPNGNAGMAQ